MRLQRRSRTSLTKREKRQYNEPVGVIITRIILFIPLTIITHEFGHFIVFNVTHDVSGIIEFKYPLGFCFQWPIEYDETRHIVSLGGFLGSLPLILVFLKRDWFECHVVILCMLVYALAEYYASFVVDQEIYLQTLVEYGLIGIAILFPFLLAYAYWFSGDSR